MAKQLNVNLAFTADVSQAQQNINALKTSLNSIASITPVTGTQLSADLQIAVNSAKQLQYHLDRRSKIPDSYRCDQRICWQQFVP